MSRIASFALIGFLFALSACNTVSGMGEDLQSGGAAVSDTAEDAQREM